MNIFLMVLTCLNIILVLALAFTVFLRVKEKKEDQRITKGLQLLQHKISILQDLSDKTDEQVQRLVYMLDSKSNELRRLTLEANEAVHMAQDTLIKTSAPMNLTTMPMSSNGMDEFSQFVNALGAQNEKMKTTPLNTAPQMSAPAMEIQNNLPQEFTETPATPSAPQSAAQTTPAVRPYSFRRVSKT